MRITETHTINSKSQLILEKLDITNMQYKCTQIANEAREYMYPESNTLLSNSC